MDLLATVSLAMGASWASGLRLYATVATLGLLGRYAGLALPGSLAVLETPWVIGVAALLFAVEFVADKIPYVDSAWDVVQTFVRIPAGAVLAAGAFGSFDPAVQIVALLLGGSLAFSSHGLKAATRATLNLSPEPVSNVVASTAEDGLSLGAVVLAWLLPALLVALVAVTFVVSLVLLPRIWRTWRRWRRPRPVEA